MTLKAWASLPDVATRWRGAPYRGWRGRAALRTLPKAEDQEAVDAMRENSESRNAWIKLRVTPAEKEAITAKAKAQGQTVTDFIRQRALDYRLRKTPLEKELVRQTARIGANLNQLARWANTYKSRAEALRVLAALLSFEKALKSHMEPMKDEQRESFSETGQESSPSSSLASSC